MKQKPEGIRVRLLYPGKRCTLRLFLSCLLPMYALSLFAVAFDVQGVLLACYVAATVLSLIALFTAALVLPFAGTAYLSRDTVTVCWFGFVTKTVEVSRLRSICAVADPYGNSLCLSCLSPDEMTQAGEEMIRKGFLSKHDVPLRKKHPNWRKNFILDYQNWMQSGLIRSFSTSKHIWICMDHSTAVIVRQLYPQLPYRYFQEKDIYNTLQDLSDCVYSPTVGYASEKVRLTEDGITTCVKGKTALHLDAAKIATIVKVDRFTNNGKYERFYTPLVVVCARTAEEMASLSGCQAEIKQLPSGKEIAVMDYCYRESVRWNRTDNKICPLHYSAKKEEQLRRLYPNAEWIDLSHMWREDSVM